MRDHRILFPRYFCGPPQTAQGGYAAGVTASLVDVPSEVRLHRPPPVERELVARKVEEEIQVVDREQVVLSARPRGPIEVELPDVDLRAVREAPVTQADLDTHAAPTCVICGPARADGFRIFPGRLSSTIVATSWKVPEDVAGPDGALTTPVIWAVLDCPGGWAFAGRGVDFFPALIVQSVEILTAPRANEEIMVLGWEVGRSDRKLYAQTALLAPDGTPMAVSSQTCYAVSPQWAS